LVIEDNTVEKEGLSNNNEPMVIAPTSPFMVLYEGLATALKKLVAKVDV